MPRPRKDTRWYDRRDNGIYYAFWYSPTKKRIERESLDTRDPEEAARRFAEWIVKGPRREPVVHAGVTVERALDDYEKDHVTPNVVDKTRQHNAITHLKAFFKDTLLRDVDVVKSRAYAEARKRGITSRKKGRGRHGGSPATVRRELHVLVAAANLALKFDRITQADLPRVELPAEGPVQRPPWLTKKQLQVAVAQAEGKLKDFVLLAYYTAARRASIEYLKKAQVDLKHGRIDLQEPGRKETKKRRPIVPLYTEIRPIVERLMEASETEYLFGAPQDFYKPFVALLADIGVKAHPHMLRHSRATHMLMDGEDPYKVAKLLGDTLATVERVYGHFSVDYLQTKSGIEVA